MASFVGGVQLAFQVDALFSQIAKDAASEFRDLGYWRLLDQAGEPDRPAGNPRRAVRGRAVDPQPVYFTRIFVKSQGFWVTLLHVPSAQLCTTFGSHARSRLTDQ